MNSVSVAALSRSGENIKFEADKERLAALALECGVTSFEKFSAFVKATRFKKSGAKLVGSLSACVTQPCVITNEPVTQHIELDVERRFLPSAEIERNEQLFEAGELILEPDADLPDEIDNGRIDLWQVLVEELCLAIDMYPRKQGAELPEGLAAKQDPDDVKESAGNHPFSSLNTLIDKKKS